MMRARYGFDKRAAMCNDIGMIKRTWISGFVVLAMTSLMGCKDKQPDKPAVAAAPSAPVNAPTPTIAKPAKPAKPASKPANLRLEAAKLDLVSAGLAELKLDATGALTVNDKVVGTLTTDGELKSPTGEVIATMFEDGTVVISGAGDDSKVIEVADDGTINVDGEPKIRIDDQGGVWLHKNGEFANDGLAVFEGSPEMRRTFAFLLVVSMAARPLPPPPPTVRSPADER